MFRENFSWANILPHHEAITNPMHFCIFWVTQVCHEQIKAVVLLKLLSIFLDIGMGFVLAGEVAQAKLPTGSCIRIFFARRPHIGEGCKTTGLSKTKPSAWTTYYICTIFTCQ